MYIGGGLILGVVLYQVVLYLGWFKGGVLPFYCIYSCSLNYKT